jgi:Ca-activated chloride channel family protein
VVLVLLPLAALAFRRGWVAALVLALGPGAMVAPQPAQALGWDDLWQRADQQAASAFAAGELERARELARAPARVGSAAYRLGDYQEAAEQFAAGAQAVDHYNRGNALARSGQLGEAIAAYDQALALDPGLDDAEYNRAQVEAALREQEREQPGQQGGDAQRSDANSGDSGGSADADPSSSPDNGQADESDSQGADQQPSEQGGNGQQGQDGQAGQGEQGAEQPGPDPESPGQQGDGAADEGGASEPRSASGADADAGPGDGAPPPGSGQRAGAGDDGQPGTSGDGAEPAAASGSERAEAERAAADYRDEATAAAASDAAAATAEPGDEDATGAGGPLAGLDAEARETRQATEQWLRRIPDDPAALLRRKFLYQYQGRQDSAEALNVDEPW